MNRARSTKKAARGFTLVEMIVSLAIFSIVATVALGALLKIVSTNNKAQNIQTTVSSVGYALESMSRELRTGTAFNCTYLDAGGTFDAASSLANNCNRGTNSNILAFKLAKMDPTGSCNLITAYYFSGSSGSYVLKKATQTACSDTGFVDGSPGVNQIQFSPILADNITLTNFQLGVAYDANTIPYPLAFIRLVGFAGIKEKDRNYFDIQTAVSGRVR